MTSIFSTMTSSLACIGNCRFAIFSCASSFVCPLCAGSAFVLITSFSSSAVSSQTACSPDLFPTNIMCNPELHFAINLSISFTSAAGF